MKPSPISTLHNYRAANANLSTAGQPTEAQLAAVAADGHEVVINLALHNDPRYSLPDEPGLVKSLGMHYIHIPVQFDALAEADLLTFFDAMDEHQDRKILVHCAANMRLTAFLGLYFAIRQGRSEDSAFALMKQVWQPNPVWSSFISDMLAKHKGRVSQR